jgi:SAM-dependent methyltransferase
MHAALHESPLFREACGPLLRPGGLELTDRGVELCRFPGRAEILDVGCASGVTVGHLRDRHGHSARGVDISRELIAEGLRRDPTLRLLRGAAESLPFADDSLDALFCECVLSLLNDPMRGLAEFHRVLRPGGKLVVSDIYLRQAPRDEAPPLGRGIASSREIQGWFVAAGFHGLLLWEDHSRKLVELAAQVMLTHGTLECLSGLCGCGEGRPGYYLLVTEKRP